MDPQIAQMSVHPYPEHVPHDQLQQHQQQHQGSMSMTTSPGIAAPPQEEVDDFLRRKRKAREHKACYPCRQRKVKCDLSRPCQTCRDREHPELCNYNPPNKRQSVDQDGAVTKQEDLGSGGGYVTIGRAEFEMLFHKLNSLEASISSLRQEIGRNAYERHPDRNIDRNIDQNLDRETNGDSQDPRRHIDVHGMHTRNDAGEIVHFGGASVPALLYALSQGDTDHPYVREMMGKSVLPMFGLDNESSTYPFVDLWGLPHGSLARAKQLAQALPNDQQLLSFFRYFKDTGYLIFPGVVDPQRMEQELTMFLINRAAQIGSDEGVTESMVYGRDYHWLGLLFAVLALGAQCSMMARKERELTSQVYICCSMECLRFVNFLAQANLEDIQALLVIGNVLINNMNAGTAWVLLGLTVRLAQSLGLHRACPPEIPNEAVFPRSKIWWSIMWQDAMLSVTYDRASATAATMVITMPVPMQYGPIKAYHASMYKLSTVLLDIVKDRSVGLSPRELFHKIGEHREAVSTIMRDAQEYLRDSRKCTSQVQTLEHWGLYLHTSYAVSEASRAAISPSTTDTEVRKAYRQLCIDSLANAVEAWLGIESITAYSRQSWSALHRGLSSALLLGILGEHTRSERARSLLSRFYSTLVDVNDKISPQELSSPVQRGLAALRKLNIQPEQRGSRFPDSVTSGPMSASDASPADENSIHVDQNTIFTPGSMTDGSLNIHEDNSPHSVLNCILWGNNEQLYQTPGGMAAM